MVSSSTSDDHLAGEQRLRDYLSRVWIETEILTPNVAMPTVRLAAAAINVDATQIIKSLLFVEPTGGVVMAIASGTAKIDKTRLSALAGTGKLSLADPATVLTATGYPAGGVSPIGHALHFPVLIDTMVMKQEVVYGGAGSEHTLLRISPKDILRLTGGQVANITVTPSQST